LLTVSVNVVTDEVNLAVTFRAPFIVTKQLVVPLQSPDHPLNVEPLLATADRTTNVPLGKLVEQVPPQLIPLGLLAIVPLPVPVFETIKV
jgi:hypothetical protein